jgi:hypothetical protein
MSPHVEDPFSGHMAQGDPRDLMFACGGCTLPSVMPYRMLMVSTNAWGVLSPLNTVGLPFEPSVPLGSSFEFWWWARGGAPWYIVCLLKKTWPYNGDNYRIEFQGTFPFGIVYSDTTFPRQTCNRTHRIQQFEVGFPVPIGGSGNRVQLLQVEWDQTRPPGGWPPPP